MKELIKFIKQKDYKYIKDLGQGGLGKTILIKDQEMDVSFVCKKYSPYIPEIKKQYYEYFKNEIKVMFQVNNPNIIRIYNYYLYSEIFTGYILMEYVDGYNIFDYIKENQSNINYIFEQVVETFKYLENIKILHRDIRIDNILVTNNGIVKLIDFGFGKKIDSEIDNNKSISLNWWCDVPLDFKKNSYDHRTEIYFVGKLFEKILKDLEEYFIFLDFGYQNILEKMIKYDPSERYKTFSELQEGMIEIGVNYENIFSYYEKVTYKKFISDLSASITEIDASTKYKTNINKIILDLENILRANALEDIIQNTRDVTRVFLDGSYRFYPQPIISCENLKEIILMFKKTNKDNSEILLINIQNRLNQINRKSETFENDIPF